MVKLSLAKESFTKLHQWGVDFAKKKGIKENELQEIIQRVRKRNK